MTKPVVIGDAELWLGDCREILPSITDISCVATSPPYTDRRLYGFDEIPAWRDLVSTPLSKIASDGAQVLINLGVTHENGEVDTYWDDLIADMKAASWRLFGWYVWDKQDGMAGDWNGRLAPSHEWVFHFNKVARKPNKVVLCKGAGLLGYKGNTGLRRQDGSLSGWTHMGVPTQQFKIADSVLRLQPQKDRRDPFIRSHPAVYPVELPLLIVESYTAKAETVCDPFMGSGTTGVACAKLGRKFIGIEIEPKYFDIACRRIEKAYAQPDFFIEKPSLPKQEALMFSHECPGADTP
jgi:DNA modification methylase